MSSPEIAVVMPLYIRGKYLRKSLVQLSKWRLPLTIYFFQDCSSKIDATHTALLNSVAEECTYICETLGLKYKFKRRDRHYGCHLNVRRAIAEIFHEHDFLYCIEDDILVSSTFALIVENLRLTDKQPFVISANTFSMLPDWGTSNYQTKLHKIWKTRIFHCWGWACSKEIWDLAMGEKETFSSFPNPRTLGISSDFPEFYLRHWDNIVESLNNSLLDSWACRFQLGLWKNNIFTMSPYANMSTHIGIDGTHYSGSWCHHNYLPFYENEDLTVTSSSQCSAYDYEREYDDLAYVYSVHRQSPLASYKQRWLWDQKHPCFRLPEIIP